MTISLYQHQTVMVDSTRRALISTKQVILRAPTGCGKTIAAAFIIMSAIAKGSTVIFTVHRRELVKQSMDAFDACGIRYGVIAAGFSPTPHHKVQIASIETLKRRLGVVKCPSLLIIDECHHASAAGWTKVLKHFAEAHVVGLTATPWRLDGKGLGSLFGDIVHGPETKWLIDNKFLSPFRAFAPPMQDMSKVHTKMGDYDNKELEALMDKPKITGDAVEHYLKICPGKRAIAFATTVKHSEHIAESFNASGVPARHIDGKMPHKDRDEAIRLFKNDEIKILTNCNIISEGFDVPAMDAAILLRPTQSLSLYLQQVGRALRHVEGKTAYILDHAGNIKSHGLPTDVFDWSLNGREKKKGKKPEVAVKVCPKCYYAHAPNLLSCPACDWVYESKRAKIQYAEGQLNEIDQENWLRTGPYKKVIAAAKTRAELEAIGKARGYKKGFAYRVLQERAANAGS